MEVQLAINATIAIANAKKTVYLKIFLSMNGTFEFVCVAIGFGIMIVGIIASFGLGILLFSAPDSFWSDICNKIEKCLDILFNDYK